MTNFLQFRCILCQKILYFAHHSICSECYRSITKVNYCSHCGALLPPQQTKNNYCGQCLHAKFLWDKLIYISPYQPPLSTLIHQFKFQYAYWLDQPLARLLLLSVLNAKRERLLTTPERLLPIPLHHWRYWRRGYNQSLLLAKYLSRYLNIAYDENLLIRNKATPHQIGLNYRARKKNLINAFSLSKPPNCRSVALIDDVLTTGATMNEICKLLRQQGVQHIQVWVLCRTLK